NGMYDPNRYATLLFNNILGGPGMNSLLNMAMRERKGYVYSVDSSVMMYSDCGLFSIYFGCDPENLKACLRIVDREIETLANGYLTDKRLAIAKRQYLGQLLLSSENREVNTTNMGKSILYFNKINSIAEITEHINALTPTDIRAIASTIIDNKSILTML
ncbi:MAG: insulinase family protein, partial [Bacteroidales bacterium]